MLKIEKGLAGDIDELERLYDELNDYLACHVNYPGWRKGIYPERTTAEDGVEEGNLFVARVDGRIVGTVILRHEPEVGYELADWHVELDYKDVLVIYTFAVHPDYHGRSLGRQLMEYVLHFAKENRMKAVRLDVYEKNLPAIRLYESCGFQYIDRVDLGYGEYGLDWFSLYQMEL